MNILYITPYYKPSWYYGGPPKCISEQAEYLVKHHNIKIDVLTLNLNGPKPLYNSQEPVVIDVNEVTVHYLPVSSNNIGRAYFESNYLDSYINKFSDIDLVHVHTLFNAFSKKGMQFAFKNNIPYIVTPHGMLDSYSLSRTGWMKRIHRLLFDDKLLASAKAVQFTTSNELRNSVLKTAVRHKIIPLGFEFPDMELRQKPAPNGMLKLVFLGRINRKKGIDLLLQGLARLDKEMLEHIHLDIYGIDDDNCQKELEDFISENFLIGSVSFCGNLAPEKRDEKLKEYHCLVLTSHQENFGIVVAEALSIALPVFISDKVNLCDFVIENSCGWVSVLEKEDISETLRTIYLTSSAERHAKGMNGYDAVRKNFSMNEVAKQYVNLYQNIVNDFQPV
jgi:glycosyltransferase involved in cell wall biosynthesis